MFSTGSMEIHILCAYVTLLALVGSVGNLIILLVYSRTRDRRATNVFIRALAGLDLCVCLVVMPYSIVYEYHLITAEFMCKLCELTRHFNVFMSNLTLVAVAAERYVAICKPTFTVTQRHVQTGVFLMVIICVFMSVPSAFIFAVVPEPVAVPLTGNETVLGNNSSNLPMDTVVQSYCMFTVSMIGTTAALTYQGFLMVIWFACMVAIIVLYVIIYRLVWKRDKARNLAKVRPSPWTTSQAVTGMAAGDDEGRSRDEQGGRKITFLSLLNKRPLKVTKANVTPVEQFELSEMSQSVETNFYSGRQPPGVILPRKSQANKAKAHRKTGTMLFLCTVIYIVTWMPFWLDVFGVTKSLAFRHLFFISNASNPIIYGIVNKQVRNAMSNIICRRKPVMR